jgi:hypothetical protein
MKGFENRTNMTHPQAPGALQEITALLEQITPGPWAWEWTAEKSNEWAVGQAFKEDGTPIEGQIGDGEWLEDTIIERRLIGMNESGHARAADAKFIAAAPRLVRELLAALAAVDARRQELEQESEDGDSVRNKLAKLLERTVNVVGSLSDMTCCPSCGGGGVVVKPKEQKALDAIADTVLKYRPKARSKPAVQRKRRKTILEKARAKKPRR